MNPFKPVDPSDQRAAPGFAEYRFDDGALIQISAYGGTVSVLQMQASTQGRGAAFLTVDQAGQLADAITAAAAEAKRQNDAAPAYPGTVLPQPVLMPSALTATDIAAINRAEARVADANAAQAAAQAAQPRDQAAVDRTTAEKMAADAALAGLQRFTAAQPQPFGANTGQFTGMAPAGQLSAQDIANIVNAALDARGVTRRP